jgi:hypothetical protein
MVLLVAAAAACAGPARETSTAHESAQAAAESREPRAESTTIASPLADSATAADVRFQVARAAVNRDARALDARSAQRHTPDYAKAFDELRRRTLAAESLRAERDALRERLRRTGGASERR